MLRVPLLLVLACAAGASVTAQASATLDLRERPLPTGTPPAFLLSHTRIMDGTPLGPNPLQVTLLEFDRSTYRPGDALVYSVLVRNTGAERIVLPWEVDWHRVAAQRPDDVFGCAITLYVRDASDTASATLRPLRLYASRRLPSTQRPLAPGDSVRLVIPAAWKFEATADAQAFARRLPSMTEVRAVLSFDRQPDPSRPLAPSASLTSAWLFLDRAPSSRQ